MEAEKICAGFKARNAEDIAAGFPGQVKQKDAGTVEFVGGRAIAQSGGGVAEHEAAEADGMIALGPVAVGRVLKLMIGEKDGRDLGIAELVETVD